MTLVSDNLLLLNSWVDKRRLIYRFCPEKRPWGRSGAWGFSCLTFLLLKMEIIDFLQPGVKQKLRENITITPGKRVTGINYVHS